MNRIVPENYPAAQVRKELRPDARVTISFETPRRPLDSYPRERSQYLRHRGRSHPAHPVFARGSLMALDLHNRMSYPPKTFIPAVERENPFDAIQVATAGLNACDFLLSNNLKIGVKAERMLRWLPLSDVAEIR